MTEKSYQAEGDCELQSSAQFVFAFSQVYFNIGRFSFDEDSTPEVVKKAIDAYRAARAKYPGDTTVYDSEINFTLDTFPDLEEILRL